MIESFTHNGYRIRLILYKAGRYYLEAQNLHGKRYIKRWSLGTMDLDHARDEFYRYKIDLQKTGRLDIVFKSELSSWIDKYLEWSRVHRSPNTARSHSYSMRYFKEFVEARKVDRLSARLFDDFKNHRLRCGDSPRSVDIRLSTVGSFATYLEHMGYIPPGPRPKLIRQKQTRLPQFYEKDELKKIIQVVGERYLRDMIIFAVNTGLRRLELAALRWEDVKDGYLIVQGYDMSYGDEEFRFEPKDHEIRRIKLNPAARAVLDCRDRVSPWVFPSVWGKPRHDMSTTNRDLKEVVRKAGVAYKGGWHALRRTFAAHLMMKGADIESVRQLLGHSDISTTQKYLNVSGQHLDGAVDLLDY